MRQSFFARLALAAGMLAQPAGVFAADISANGTITIDLNKLEQRGKDCSVFFVVTNAGPVDYSTFKPDVVFFRADGVIDIQLSIDMGRIRPGVSIRSVPLSARDCKSIGSIVIDDVLECKSGTEDLKNCFDQLVLKSTSQVTFTK